MSMFPTATSRVFYNEAGEPTWWESTVQEAPDPDDFHSDEADEVDHTVEVDSTGDAGDPAFAAFCSCGWRSEWVHADQFGDPNDQDAFDEAYDTAVADGAAHTDEN